MELEDRMFKVYAKGDEKIQLKIIPGHFVTSQSHISHYLEMTTMKTRCAEAARIAKLLSSRYETSTPVDSIICMDGLEVIGAFLAEELAKEEDLILLCGHYEGIDERVLEEIVTDYVSIGDYVLTGGELPAMVMVDAISRLVPGVLHNDVSAEFESFQDNLLEYPQYSRPEEWHGKKVPSVLLSGHHANIEKWRREQSIIRTYERRPDLFEKCELTEKEKQWLKDYLDDKISRHQE